MKAGAETRPLHRTPAWPIQLKKGDWSNSPSRQRQARNQRTILALTLDVQNGDAFRVLPRFLCRFVPQMYLSGCRRISRLCRVSGDRGLQGEHLEGAEQGPLGEALRVRPHRHLELRVPPAPPAALPCLGVRLPSRFVNGGCSWRLHSSWGWLLPSVAPASPPCPCSPRRIWASDWPSSASTQFQRCAGLSRFSLCLRDCVLAREHVFTSSKQKPQLLDPMP